MYVIEEDLNTYTVRDADGGQSLLASLEMDRDEMQAAAALGKGAA